MLTNEVKLPDVEEVKDAVIQVIEDDGIDVSSNYSHEFKLDGSLVTETDRRIQNKIFAILKKKWSDFGAMGEEMTHAQQVSICENSDNGFWVLDPLDGTTNFTSGFLFFGVSLALVVNGLPRIAVIYDPVRKECFYAKEDGGAYLNGTRLDCQRVMSLNQCIANVDYKRLVGDLAERLVRSPPYRSQRNLGSSVLEWCWLAAGRVQLYLHGGQKLWDFAAGYLILKEAGGAATSLSGNPLDCAKLKKRSVVAAVSDELLDEWYEWIQVNSCYVDSPTLYEKE